MKILENEVYEVWHKLDKKFRMPHGHVKINVLSPKHMTSAYK